MKNRFSTIFLVSLVLLPVSIGAVAQTASVSSNSANEVLRERHESTRSDKFTGGRIERTRLEPGNPNIKITVDVPAFQLTLWQDEKEVKTYPIGVGLEDYPIFIGEMSATQVIWNPSWIVPNSDWVAGHKGVKPGDVIKATNPANPLGKLKIPLGYGYLIHEAKGIGDLGNLVSHGCVRMLRRDLYDLADKIIAARRPPVSPAAIAKAKASKTTVVAELESPVAVDINYDTIVIADGRLHIYQDFYERGTNSYRNLQRELTAHNLNPNAISERAFERILARLTRTRAFVVPVQSVEADRTLTDGRMTNVIPSAPAAPTRPRRRT